MGEEELLLLVREALALLLRTTAPVVGAALVGGLLVALVQTATQVQEATIGFAVRAAAVVLALLLLGGWLASEMVGFTEQVLGLLLHPGAPWPWTPT